MRLESLQDRIRYCVEQVGTQTEFVSRSQVSRAQLSRYLDGESKPPIDRLSDIASVSGVDLAWLVTGEGTPCKSSNQFLSFSYDLLKQVIKVFEEALMEYQGAPLTPAQKSVLIPLVQASLEHERTSSSTHDAISKSDMINILDYASSMAKHDMLEKFSDYTFDMMVSNKDPESNAKLGTFSNLTSKACEAYFSSTAGENYCYRTKDIINSYAQKSLFKVMETLFGHVSEPKIKMLDLGCGSGRYMSYIHANYDRIDVQGIESSQLPYSVCKDQEAAGKIPTGATLLGDARNLPYQSNTFDFVFSKAVLHWLPHFKHAHFGVNEVFSEVARVLKPGGSFYFDARHGDGQREYLPFNQTYSAEDVRELAKKHGFKVLWIHTDSNPHFPELVDDFEGVHHKYKDFISVYMVKN